MARYLRIGLALITILAVVVIAYTGYVGWEGSRQLVVREGMDPDCRTPDVLYGWDYEAINYDLADDALLKDRNADLRNCSYTGTRAGDEVVTDDGIHIAGWYIPAASGIGPEGPTVVLVHGFKATKTGILKYGVGLHEDYNLVAFDMRSMGRSTGDQTTGGVLEQQDLRAVIDWLERTKGPAQIGLLGNSLGAATALAEARDDARVDALVLDSMHTRIRYQIEARVDHGGYPSYFGTTWAITFGIWVRTGVDIESIDAVDTISGSAERPILLIHGTADNEDLPARTQAFHDAAVAAGMDMELHWCEGSGHNAPAGMPAEVCATDFATWTADFFGRALAL